MECLSRLGPSFHSGSVPFPAERCRRGWRDRGEREGERERGGYERGLGSNHTQAHFSF